MTIASATLAIDCSFAGLSLALQTDAGVTHFTTQAPRSSDILPTELQRLMQQENVAVSDLTTILVAIGPGSFTGIRLGLATAEAFKLLNPSIQIIGLSTLHALATHICADYHPQTDFTVLLDAAGGQAYTQIFNPNGEPQTTAECIPVPPTEGTLFAQASLMHATATPIATLDARHMLSLAENRTAHLPPQPVYIKPLTYKKVQ